MMETFGSNSGNLSGAVEFCAVELTSCSMPRLSLRDLQEGNLGTYGKIQAQ